jgi:hypothetical protein
LGTLWVRVSWIQSMHHEKQFANRVNTIINKPWFKKNPIVNSYDVKW